MIGAVVLRPEPGNARTAARLGALGIAVERCPLFTVVPVDWAVPAAASYDALLLTSANAARHGGGGLAALADLPVVAVGAATAQAAAAAGLTVALTGAADATTVVAAARARGWTRLLHLAGRDRGALPGLDQRTVYASEVVRMAQGGAKRWTGHLALLHSVRAAQRFAALVDDDGVARGAIGVAAISARVADAAGDGWAARVVAPAPADPALVGTAAALIDRAGTATDKRRA